MFDKSSFNDHELSSASGALPVHETLALRAWAHPDKVLFTFLDDEGAKQESLTYLQMYDNARGIARQLESVSQPGDRIALFFPQGLDFIACFLACLMSGRIAVPINLPNRRRVERCVSILLDSGASLALVDTTEHAQLERAFAGTEAAALPLLEIANLEAAAATASREPRAEFDPQQIAFLQYTSGSTSAPKGVMVSHANITANLRMMRDAWELDARSDFVTWQPHHHDMGLILGQLLPIMLGNHTVVMAPSTFVRQPLIWLQAISRYKARLAGGPNFAYDLAAERYNAERLGDLDLSGWTHALNGADVVRAGSLKRFHDRYARHGFSVDAFMPCYGLAEATLFVSGGPYRLPVRSVTADQATLSSEQRVAPPRESGNTVTMIGCGEPSWEVEVAIVDPATRQRRTPGTVGEIWLRGASIARGYWRNDAASIAGFHATIAEDPRREYMRTGDLGFICAEDRQLYVCGRLKDLIICEGRNIHPEDIEHSVIEALAETRPQSCAVFSHDDEQQRQIIVAVIELNRELKRLLTDNPRVLKASIRAAVVDQHGIPVHRLMFAQPTSMHKTTSGKIQRRKMRELYLAAELDGIDEAI